jgi:hypothetical protein
VAPKTPAFVKAVKAAPPSTTIQSQVAKSPVAARGKSLVDIAAAPAMTEDGRPDADLLPAKRAGSEAALASTLRSFKQYQDMIRVGAHAAVRGDGLGNDGASVVNMANVGATSPAVWAKHASALRTAILSSGLTLDEYMATSGAPVSEQMAAFWEDTVAHQGKPGGAATARGEMPSAVVAALASNEEMDDSPPVRVSVEEARELIAEAMQNLPVADPVLATRTLQDMLLGYASALAAGIAVPSVSAEYKAAVTRWASSNTLAAKPAQELLKIIKS